MIAFLPKPYPDELLYSILSRYYVRSGYMSYAAAKQAIFADSRKCVSVDFINRSAAEVLQKFIPIKQIISKHTMFPYYCRFEHKRTVLSDFRMLPPKSVIPVNKVFRLRYCPLCADYDRSQYGEAYWHRIHQINDIRICNAHKCLLESTNIQKSVSGFYSAEETIPNKQAVKYSGNALEVKLAEYIVKVFEYGIDLDAPLMAADYINYELCQAGFMSVEDNSRDVYSLWQSVRQRFDFIPIPDFKTFKEMFVRSSVYPYEMCILGLYMKIPPEKLAASGFPKKISLDNMIVELLRKNTGFNSIAHRLGTTYEYVYDVCREKIDDPILFDKGAYGYFER